MQTLTAGDPAGAILNVQNLVGATSNNSIIDSNITVNLLDSGAFTIRGGTVDGQLNVTNGATLTYTASQNQNGSGSVNVAAGGTIAMDWNKSLSPSVDNDGLIAFGNSIFATFSGTSITGSGEWQFNSGGAIFNNAAMVIALDPAAAEFTGSAGTVKFDNVAAGTHTLGSFDMSGTNTVQFDTGLNQTFELGGDSTFQDLLFTSHDTLDLAPLGSGGLTHTVNGSLTFQGNVSPDLIASDAGGAVLNVDTFINNAVNNPQIETGVTVNITGSGSWTSNGGMTNNGVINIESGVEFLHRGRELWGGGQLNILAGGTLTLDGTTNNNRKIDNDVINDGLLVSTNNNIRPINGAVGGTGVFLVESGTLDVDNASVDGWTGTGTFDSEATWHVQSPGIIDLLGGTNSIDAIGADATIILENNGTILQLNSGARNNLTVAGTLLVEGTTDLLFNAGQGITVAASGTLAGDGTVSGSVIASGTVAPAGSDVGTLSIGDGLELATGSTLEIQIDGASGDQLMVTGAVILAGNLTVSALSAPTAGSYVIIDNDGVDPVSGTFAGIPEGGTVSDGTTDYAVSYTGGDGNDVVLTPLVCDCSALQISVWEALCDEFELAPPTSTEDGESRTNAVIDSVFGTSGCPLDDPCRDVILGLLGL